jgi:hypothetical protein
MWVASAVNEDCPVKRGLKTNPATKTAITKPEINILFIEFLIVNTRPAIAYNY